MTEDQLELLKDYIECCILQGIEEAFGRDSLGESIRTREAERLLDATVVHE